MFSGVYNTGIGNADFGDRHQLKSQICHITARRTHGTTSTYWSSFSSFVKRSDNHTYPAGLNARMHLKVHGTWSGLHQHQQKILLTLYSVLSFPHKRTCVADSYPICDLFGLALRCFCSLFILSICQGDNEVSIFPLQMYHAIFILAH